MEAVKEDRIVTALETVAKNLNILFMEVRKSNEYLREIADVQKQAHLLPQLRKP